MGKAITVTLTEIIENGFLVEENNLHLNSRYNEIVLCEQVHHNINIICINNLHKFIFYVIVNMVS